MLILLSPLFSRGQDDTTRVQLINPANLVTPAGYAHAARVDLGNCYMVMISGQIAVDSKGRTMGKDSFAVQATVVFNNIRAIVEAAGGNMNHLTKIGMFVTDMSHLGELRQVRDKYINTKRPPASTLVQVSRLIRDDLMIEVEATAIIPKK